MGEVYRAHDTRLDRSVAIKVLPAHLASDERLRERFDREARAVAALSHPHICAVYDFGDAPNPEPHIPNPGHVSYLVMELLEGETLDRRIHGQPMPPADVVELALQIASGLEAAHAKGIVHRDIKPGNIFVTTDGRIKIMDFGLAMLATTRPAAASFDETSPGHALTAAGSTLGTAAYMSPEQARGEPVDARTDVFAFGAVLFQMATGRAAFGGATLATVFDAVLNTTPPPASTVAPGVSPDLSQLISKALEKDRQLRYQSVSDLRADLQRIAKGETSVTAARTEPPAPTRARRPVAWIAALAAGAAIVAAAAVTRYARPAPPAASTGAPIRSLAVLPLENLSSASGADLFTDGMTDELIGALARIRGWRVISRTSVMQYKNARKPLPAIAQELGVDALVEGSVQQSGNRVRITATLVRGDKSEENLWTETFDRDLKDVLDIEADVARAIASQIKVTLTPQEQERLAVRRPVDPEVFQLVLRGRAAADQGTEDSLFKAIGYFEQALAKNPMYAPAHAAIALAYGSLNPAYRAPKEVMPKSREHAVQAIELDEGLSEAHAALGSVMFRYDWDWANAETEIQRAIGLNPNSADAHELYGNYLVAVGRNGPAIEELTLAHQLNPSALPTYSSLLAGLLTTRAYDRTIAESRRALELNPNFAFAYAWMGMAYVLKGQLTEGIPFLERARMLDDNVTTTHFLAMAQAAAGNKALAEKLVSGLEAAAATRYTCAYEVASVHLRLGNKEKAMEWLKRGLDEQCDCMVWLTSEPWIDPLRVDPRYADLVKRVGFPAR